MKVRVTKTDQSNSKTHFVCSCGEAYGYWPEKPPPEGTSQVVEFDCDEELTLGVNAKETTLSSPRIRSRDNKIEITAFVLSLYEEGTVLLSFDDGRLEIERSEASAPFQEGTWVVVTLEKIDVYSVSL